MRLALIAGGTRCIGAATSIRLKETGYKVAAIYMCNNEVATKFSTYNKIDISKWFISNYKKCLAGIKKVKKHLVR